MITRNGSELMAKVRKSEVEVEDCVSQIHIFQSIRRFDRADVYTQMKAIAEAAAWRGAGRHFGSHV